MHTIRFILALILAAGLAGNTYAQTPERPPIVDFEGLEPVLEHRNDTIYVINFWATWCAPCVKEMPLLQRLQANADATGMPLKVVLVSLDFVDRLDQTLYPFMVKYNLKPEVIVLDDPRANDWIDKVDPTWSGALPATLVYCNDRRKFRNGSFSNFEELKAFIHPFIKDNNP